MLQFLLVRHANTVDGMFGTLWAENAKLFDTIECSWRGNKSNISCIPSGQYVCTFSYSPAFKRKMYLVQGVQGRSGIRIHAGNVAGMRDKGLKSDFHGCIGLGMRRGVVFNQPAILSSAIAVRKLVEITQEQDFVLTIQGEFQAYE